MARHLSLRQGGPSHGAHTASTAARAARAVSRIRRGRTSADEHRRPGSGNQAAAIRRQQSGTRRTVIQWPEIASRGGARCGPAGREPPCGVPAPAGPARVINPESATVLRSFFEDRLRTTGRMVDRAVARGELPDGTDAAEVLAALGAPFYYRILIARRPVDQALAESAATAVWAAARAGAYTRARPADD
ncbi:TetR-like C-terminal domain-containing protein [Streptomyces celluloflavus]|uniref:TetR-like C-terminal domain-containing protein n=1 Tax=Streptomyces celluloflavus TaxID=58344 RepID=UPI0036DC653E